MNEVGDRPLYCGGITMNRLWAPWRMKYILSSKKTGGGCILCEEAQKNDDRKN
jgi:hypothetical protein